MLEAKDVRETSDQRYDQGMLRARSQAENYARALPADEGRPPFVVNVDVGRSIELYSEFSRSGAKLVLWIGYLQWHFRTRGAVMPPEPVLKDFRNIECRDAVLTWDRVDYATDERGVPLTRWDGKTMKTSPVTGEPIPDESARLPLERYLNPRKAAWPQADFVVGNPPFIGNKRMRIALGDGYVDALRGACANDLLGDAKRVGFGLWT